MKRLTNWIRARLFGRRWAAMREAAAYRPRSSAWDYHPCRRRTLLVVDSNSDFRHGGTA